MPVVHLVCRDCDHENLWSNTQQANRDKFDHHRTFGHTVAFGVVEQPEGW